MNSTNNSNNSDNELNCRSILIDNTHSSHSTHSTQHQQHSHNYNGHKVILNEPIEPALKNELVTNVISLLVRSKLRDTMND